MNLGQPQQPSRILRRQGSQSAKTLTSGDQIVGLEVLTGFGGQTSDPGRLVVRDLEPWPGSLCWNGMTRRCQQGERANRPSHRMMPNEPPEKTRAPRMTVLFQH